MDTLEEMQRQQIFVLLKKIAKLEDVNRSLFNRCMAITHGSICSWCMIAKDCTVKLETIKIKGGKTNE